MEGTAREGGVLLRTSLGAREAAVPGRPPPPGSTWWLSWTGQTLPMAVCAVALIAAGYFLQDQFLSPGGETAVSGDGDQGGWGEWKYIRDGEGGEGRWEYIRKEGKEGGLGRWEWIRGEGEGGGRWEYVRGEAAAKGQGVASEGGKDKEGEKGKEEKGNECEREEESVRNMLQKAEEQYEDNLRHRDALVNFETYAKQKHVPGTHLKANVLVPTYPCAREQRFGPWGEGEASFCLEPTPRVCTVARELLSTCITTVAQSHSFL